jgi:hypothetical protein
MIRTKQWWTDSFLDWMTVNPVSDTKIQIDAIDVSLYLQMSVEFFQTERAAGKFPNVKLSSFAIKYPAVGVVDSVAVLPHYPSLGAQGVISITNCGVIYPPREEGVNLAVFRSLKKTASVPFVTIYNNIVQFEYDPKIKAVDVLMIPELTALTFDDLYALPDGAKDIVFAKAQQFAIQKVGMKQTLRNDSRPNEEQYTRR